MSDETPLSEEQANAIYDILVAECGASEMLRREFVASETHRYISEYRFGGNLGTGGKFYRETYRDVPFRVSCYPEHWNHEREGMIVRTNTRLAALFAASADPIPEPSP